MTEFSIKYSFTRSEYLFLSLVRLFVSSTFYYIYVPFFTLLLLLWALGYTQIWSPLIILFIFTCSILGTLWCASRHYSAKPGLGTEVIFSADSSGIKECVKDSSEVSISRSQIKRIKEGKRHIFIYYITGEIGILPVKFLNSEQIGFLKSNLGKSN